MPASTLAAPVPAVETYPRLLAPGEAGEYAARMVAALRAPQGPGDVDRIVQERAVVETRFGPIDWAR